MYEGALVLIDPYIGNTWTNSEIYIRRLPIDEALSKLDRHLNYAFMVGIHSVRVVHGKGTGMLRSAVHDDLERNTLVKNYRNGYIGEGDAGVTIIEMHSRWQTGD